MPQYFDRSKLRNGDLLVWHKSSRESKGIDYLSLVRLFTTSEFGHVSTVSLKDGKPWHVEAVMPRVQWVPIPPLNDIYVIPMRMPDGAYIPMDFFDEKIGLSYSIVDAICAYMGWTLQANTRWQCAELCLAFYRQNSLCIPDAFTPSRLVLTVLENCDTSMYKLSL